MRGVAKNHPRYRFHKKSGQAIVTLSGKDFYLGPYDSEKSRDEYDRLLAKWLANGRCWPQELESDRSYVEQYLNARLTPPT